MSGAAPEPKKHVGFSHKSADVIQIWMFQEIFLFQSWIRASFWVGVGVGVAVGGAKREVRSVGGTEGGMAGCQITAKKLIISAAGPRGRSWRAHSPSSGHSGAAETGPRWNWFRFAVTVPHDKSWRGRSRRRADLRLVFFMVTELRFQISRFFGGFFPYRHTSCIKM